jgi:uncharacterized protein (TIGR02270 family)
LVIEEVVIQHAEEAAFLWLLRDNSVHAPHYLLNDLANLDSRIEANLDGLHIAGDKGWEICKESFAWKEAGEIFTAAILAFESGDDARIQLVLEMGTTEPALCRGIASALGWLPHPRAEKYIYGFLTSNAPILRRIGIAAAAIHRKDPGKQITDVLSDVDPLLKTRALRAVGELGRRTLLPFVTPFMNETDDNCRYAAAWSALLLGDVEAVSILRSFTAPTSSYGEAAVKLAMRQMDRHSAYNWHKELAQNPDMIRLAVIGASVIGDPVSLPWLIEQMTIPPLARVAGEAFTMITGVDIAYEDLEGEWPDGFAAGPTEDPEDENVAMDPDEDLPWPAPERIARWWHAHRSAFQSGTRYLLGKPISPAWLQDVLRHGRQRQRAAAALELAMRQPGQPLFEVRAPGFRQQQLLRKYARQGEQARESERAQ